MGNVAFTLLTLTEKVAEMEFVEQEKCKHVSEKTWFDGNFCAKKIALDDLVNHNAIKYLDWFIL